MKKAANDLIQNLERVHEDRFIFAEPAQLYQIDGSSLECVIVNLSRVGCRIESAEHFHAGAQITIESIGWPPLIATVMWSDDGITGLEFSAPIRTNTFAMMVRTAAGLDRLGDDIMI